MSEEGGEEGDVEVSGKRKCNSPLSEGNQKKRATEITKLMEDVYRGVVNNSFISEALKESCKQLKELLEKSENNDDDTARKGCICMHGRKKITEAYIRKEMEKSLSDSEWLSLRKEIWPEETYKNVELASGSIKNAMKEETTIVVANKGDALFKELAGIFPVIADLEEDILKNHKTGLRMEKEEVIKIQGLEPKDVKSRKCTLFPYEETTDQMEKLITAIKDEIVGKTCELFTLFIPESWVVETTRKELERSLLHTQIVCVLNGKKLQIQDLKGRKNTSSEDVTVTIPMGGKTYAEALTELKGKVAPERLGIEIKTVRQDRENVKVVVRGNDMKKTANFIEEINRTTSAGAALQKRRRSVFVYNLEDNVSEEEIKEELSKILNRNDLDLRISRRTDNRGNSALITMDESDAMVIINTRSIRRSGWTNWTIKEKINPRFCVKCQMYGHQPRDCPGPPARSIRCMNCGKCDGHFSKDCKKEPECPCCNVKGHRMNSTACPSFRLYLDIERQKSDF